MIVKQKIRCPQCYEIRKVIFKKECNTWAVCPACRRPFPLTFVSTEEYPNGFWIPVIDTEEEQIAYVAAERQTPVIRDGKLQNNPSVLNAKNTLKGEVLSSQVSVSTYKSMIVETDISHDI